MTVKKDVIVIGAGPAGLAAAVEVKKTGIDDVLVIEREPHIGGILNQCIHDGFGIKKFNETLTGPEYAHRYKNEAQSLNVEILSGTMVLSLTKDRQVIVVGPQGMETYQAGAVVLAMGCRERTRGALSIPGYRPAGIYTAGVAQHLVNLKNIMIGKKVVILGSGDIGLIMARRLTLEGAEVIAVVEKLPFTSGLPRNITQCLEDYGIPLLLSHTVTNIEGRDRLKSLTISKVDEKGNPVPGTSRKIECDTLILSVGLIPENEISIDCGVKLDEVTGGAVVDENLQTSIPGIFACGNVLQVHDLVDHVSEEGERAGRSAALFASGKLESDICTLPIKPGKGIRYVVPQFVSGKQDVTISMRVNLPSRDKKIVIKDGDRLIKSVSFRKLNPAEMVRIDINPCDLKCASGLEVGIDE